MPTFRTVLLHIIIPQYICCCEISVSDSKIGISSVVASSSENQRALLGRLKMLFFPVLCFFVLKIIGRSWITENTEHCLPLTFGSKSKS